jgi:hypothetical protein
MAESFDNHEDRLAWLAVGIGEWSNAIAHIESLVKVGHFVNPSVLNHLRIELARLCQSWVGEAGWPSYNPETQQDEVVAEARAWSTSHLGLVNIVTTEGSEG